MKEALLETVERQALFDKTKPLIVAVSGGVDSMVLLDVLLKLKYNIIIAHVNHGIREASEKEMNYLKMFAKKHTIGIEIHRIENVPTRNFQHEARNIRYEFFKDIANKYKTDQIVLAHHLDDQLETYFMRLIHNHNLLSMRGMHAIETFDGYTLIRPFLKIEKSELENYAKKGNLTYFEDTSNLDTNYMRNRFRHQFLPFIRRENPNYKTALMNHMFDLQDIQELLTNIVSNLYEKHCNSMPLNVWKKQQTIIQKAYLLHCMKTIKPDAFLSDEHFKTVRQQINSDSNFVTYLTKDIVLNKEYSSFFIDRSKKKKTIYFEIFSDGMYTLQGNEYFSFSKTKKYHKTSNCFELWYNVEVYPLELRTRLNGDYIEFEYGTKKLKDLFIDLKIPPSRRSELLLLTQGSKVLWIPELKIEAYQKPLNKKLYVCKGKDAEDGF